MGIIYTSSPIFIILISSLFFGEKINIRKIIGLISCLTGVFAIIIKGDLDLLIDLKFTIGDLWMLAASIGWALYSIYLFYWKTKLQLFQRFVLVAFFGALSLFPFYKLSSGASVFKFDKNYDKFTLNIALDKQLFGPIILKSSGTLNLTNDSDDSWRTYTRDYSAHDGDVIQIWIAVRGKLRLSVALFTPTFGHV